MRVVTSPSAVTELHVGARSGDHVLGEMEDL